MSSKLLFGEEARKKLLEGMSIAYEATSTTLGSRGQNAVFRRWGLPVITNDGVTILRHVNLEDGFQAMGADLLKQASEKTNEEAGDGTTTSSILSYNLIMKGLDILKENKELHPMRLKKEMDEALKLALDKLSEKATKIKNDKELLEIANISVENPEVAKLVAEAVKESGETGRVIIEESNGVIIEKEKIEGMEIGSGFISPYMVTHPDKMECILNSPSVLITDKTFSLNKDLFPWLDEFVRGGKTDLLLICKNLEVEALQTVIANRMNGKINLVAIKSPEDKDVMEDIAAITNAVALTEDKGMKNILIGHFGKARKVIVTKDKCLIIKDKDVLNSENYNKRVSDIMSLIKDLKDKEKDTAEERLAKLTSSIVVVKVGAQTEAERTYLKLKIDDAVNAVKAAVQEGYVAGAGVTLFKVCEDVLNELKTFGADVLYKAGRCPIECLIENSGGVLDESKISYTDGFDTDSGKYVKDLISKGIIDPVKVTKSALKNAVSLASMFLTIHTVFVEIKDKE